MMTKLPLSIPNSPLSILNYQYHSQLSILPALQEKGRIFNWPDRTPLMLSGLCQHHHHHYHPHHHHPNLHSNILQMSLGIGAVFIFFGVKK